MLAVIAPVASASLIQIQMGGVDLRYNGTNVFDAGPGANPDPLTNVTFLVDGFQPGPADTTGVALELDIQGVLNIPVGGGQVGGTGGTLALTLGGGEYLSLDLSTISITYIPVTATIQFVFVGTAASSTGQNLPYSISIDDPISVSFSTQTVQPVGQSGSFLSSFSTAGTGEIQGFGTGVPEPATLALLGMGLGTVILKRRRR